jgi:F0F1-type ATP synthase membrane subunit b/b'
MNDAIGLLELLMAAGAVIVLVWFVWSFVLRRYWRALRMRHARERREIEEAARRPGRE